MCKNILARAHSCFSRWKINGILNNYTFFEVRLFCILSLRQKITKWIHRIFKNVLIDQYNSEYYFQKYMPKRCNLRWGIDSLWG